MGLKVGHPDVGRLIDDFQVLVARACQEDRLKHRPVGDRCPLKRRELGTCILGRVSVQQLTCPGGVLRACC